jgi:hypothetical protein
MRLNLRYEREGQVHEVTTNLAVIVAWERKFRAKAAQLANQIGAEDLLYLAFEASKRNGIVVPADFDRFVEGVTDIEVVDTQDSNPTHGEPFDVH